MCYALVTRTGRQKALYAWEISQDKNKERKPLQLDSGVFLPCSEFGLYTKEAILGKAEDKIDETTKVIIMFCVFFLLVKLDTYIP